MECAVLLSASSAAVVAVLLAAWLLSGGPRHPLAALKGTHPGDLLEAATFAVFPDVVHCRALPFGGMFDRIEFTVVVHPDPQGCDRDSHGFRLRREAWARLIRAMVEADVLPETKVDFATGAADRVGRRRGVHGNIVDILLKAHPGIRDPDLDLAQEIMES